MKNFAICFSGAIRSFHLCHESIKTMIIEPLKKEYNVYIFGHFWTMKQEENLHDLAYRMKWKKDSESVYEIIKNFGFTEYIIEEYNSKREKQIMEGLSHPFHTSHTSEIMNLPRPVMKTVTEAKLAAVKQRALVLQENKSNVELKTPTNKGLADRILESYKKIEDPEKRSQYLNYAVNCMGMYYKIMMANKLKNSWAKVHNIKFDYVARMRPDFFWNEKIPAGIFEKLEDKDIVLVYDNYCTHARWQGNDKFFGGTNAMMEKYTDLYNQFEYFFDKDIRIEGQELAQGMIKKLGLHIVFFGNEKTYDKCAGPLYRKLEREMAQKEHQKKKTK